MPEKKNVYLTLHKNFVRTDIEYTDKHTGEVKTFNAVTLPKGTIIEGTDVGSYQFSPLFVNEARYKGENFRDVPLLADREVWLKRTVLDEEGSPVLDESGKPERDVVKVMPQEIKDALDKQRTEYLAAHAKDKDKEKAPDKGSADKGLADKAQVARNGSAALGSSAPTSPERDTDVRF